MTSITSLPIFRTQEVSDVPTAKSPETQPLRILAVDDEKQIVDSLAIMLESLGHNVIGISDGQQALDYLDKEDFDLVITDLDMPVISGWDIAAKAKSRKADLPVVLVTGWGDGYKAKDLAEASIDAVLSKPFIFNDLMKIISEQYPEKN